MAYQLESILKEKDNANRATCVFVRTLNSHPGLARRLVHLAAECVAQAGDGEHANWRACDAFGEKAPDFILEHLRRYHFPDGLDELAGNYMAADYEQIFALLSGESEVRDAMAGNTAMFDNLRLTVGARRKADEDYGGWSNHATWLANLHLDNDSEQLYKMSMASIEECARNVKIGGTLREFVRACVYTHKRMIRRLAMKNIENRDEEPSELFGLYGDVDYHELVASRIEDAGIREITVTGFELQDKPAKKMTFFIPKDADPAAVVRAAFGCPYLREKKDGDVIRMTDEQGWELFTIDKVEPLKLQLARMDYWGRGLQSRTFVLRKDEKPSEILPALHNDWTRVEIKNDNEGIMFNEKGKPIRSWRPLVAENEPKAAPSMSM